MLSEGKVSHSEEWCFWAKKDVKLLDSIPQRWWEDWSTSLLREGLGGSYQCMLIAAGGMPGEWSQALLDGAQWQGQGLQAHTETQRFLPNIHWVSGQALAQAAQRGCGVSILGENQKPTGHNSWTTSSRCPWRCWTQMFSRAPFCLFERYGNMR